MHHRSGPATEANGRNPLMLPGVVSDATVGCLDHVARALVALGVSANAVSLLAAGVAVVASVLLSLGHFGLAAAAMTVASLGDALDGLVARRSGSASVSGALLDAAVDRYEEFLFVGGLAVFFRTSVPALVLALFALAGSFMVSYGSAKAEALAVPVPAGAMRRADRAVCLCVGAGATGVLGWAAHHSRLPEWLVRAPLLAALAMVAVVANGSAIRRLRSLGSLARVRPEAGPVTRGEGVPLAGAARVAVAKAVRSSPELSEGDAAG
jgi:phosphatidylglycerophosphate synthase